MKRINKQVNKVGAVFIRGLADLIKEMPNIINDLLVYESLARKDLRISGIDPAKFYQGFKNLERRGVARQSGKGFLFTKNGKKWCEGTLLRYFKVSETKWDSKWRIIIFDIPQEFHKARVRFSRKLKRAGFYMLQKSVFVFPYPCDEEIGYMCAQLRISDFVDLIVAESAGFKEDKIKRFFGL